MIAIQNINPENEVNMYHSQLTVSSPLVRLLVFNLGFPIAHMNTNKYPPRSTTTSLRNHNNPTNLVPLSHFPKRFLAPTIVITTHSKRTQQEINDECIKFPVFEQGTQCILHRYE